MIGDGAADFEDGVAATLEGAGGGRHGGPGLLPLLGTALIGGGGQVDGRSSGTVGITPSLLLLELLLLFEVVEMGEWLDRRE